MEKLKVSRDFKKENTIVKVNDISIGGKKIVTMAGPCTVDAGNIVEVAEAIKDSGADMLRAGAFKPRSSPYSFQGSGEKGLKALAEAREKTGLPVITEVMDSRAVKLIEQYTDIIQVGARNMQNFSLLKELANAKKPVLLKRGLSATVDELLLAAEYIAMNGKQDIILCERGIRTFNTYTRNTLDLSIIPELKKRTHLPIIVDPSHATGVKDFVLPMGLAAIAAGADGLLIEAMPDPEKAISDKAQTINTAELKKLIEETRKVAKVMGRE